MTLSLSIATIAWFSKNFTLCYDYDTFQPKIGQCGMESAHYILTLRDLNQMQFVLLFDDFDPKGNLTSKKLS